MKMARSSVVGDEDVNKLCRTPPIDGTLPKKPRTDGPINEAVKTPAAATATADSRKQPPLILLSSEEVEVEKDEVQTSVALVDVNPIAIPDGKILIDTDLLDCAGCHKPLRPPVYECENGHLACGYCFTKKKKICLSCSSPIGNKRCGIIEKVIESTKSPCPNVQHGCMKKIHYGEKLDHEKKCEYSLCSCPYPGCEYIGVSKSVYTHFSTQHRNDSRRFYFTFHDEINIILTSDQNQVFLQEKDHDDILFILIRALGPLGSVIHVVCVGPMSLDHEYFFFLKAIGWPTLINLEHGSVEVTQKWIGQPPTKQFLHVPKCFTKSNGILSLKLKILSDADFPW